MYVCIWRDIIKWNPHACSGTIAKFFVMLCARTYAMCTMDFMLTTRVQINNNNKNNNTDVLLMRMMSWVKFNRVYFVFLFSFFCLLFFFFCVNSNNHSLVEKKLSHTFLWLQTSLLFLKLDYFETLEIWQFSKQPIKTQAKSQFIIYGNRESHCVYRSMLWWYI